ncbi:MAG: hypothetical protein OXU73_00630 [Candidatus Campbellbacteria bacterium]|nr:hypothetical protein [Candidatus Campbellbacteria bacterium]
MRYIKLLRRPIAWCVIIWFILSIALAYAPTSILLALLAGYPLSQFIVSLVVSIPTMPVYSSDPTIFYIIVFMGATINFLIYYSIGVWIEQKNIFSIKKKSRQ